MYCLFRAVVPTHSYAELTHSSTVHKVRQEGRGKPVEDSRFFQLIALENLSNYRFAGIVGITQVQPVGDSNLPTPILNLFQELPFLG